MSLLAAAMSEFQAHPRVNDKFCETLNPELIAEALEATGRPRYVDENFLQNKSYG